MPTPTLFDAAMSERFPRRSTWPFMSARHGEAANEPRDPDAFRWLAIVTRPDGSQVRELIAAECQIEAEEKAEVLQALALSLDFPFVLRPVTCKDMGKHADLMGSPWMGEHDLREVDPTRDPDAKGLHYSCRHCGRCEWRREDFNDRSN